MQGRKNQSLGKAVQEGRREKRETGKLTRQCHTNIMTSKSSPKQLSVLV